MRSYAALLAVLLALTAVAGVGGANPSVGDQPSLADRSPSVNGTDRQTVLRIEPNADGDAQWTVTTRFSLDGPSEVASFERFATAFERDRQDATFSADLFREIARRKSAGDGRGMEIRNVDRDAPPVNGSTGTLSLTFTWTNFTSVDGNRIVVEDAFRLGSDTWLPALTSNQRLVIEAPDGYYVESSPFKGHTNGTLRYEGPRTFEPGKISVTYQKEESPFDLPPFDISTVSGVALVLLVVGTGGVGAYALSRRQEEGAVSGERPESGDVGPKPASRADAEPEEEEVDVGLLSDEERVLQLLDAHDGRMKQGDIVTETNWSNAKVSQLLSRMADDGRVDKLRIGRENLITLPDEDVTDVE